MNHRRPYTDTPLVPVPFETTVPPPDPKAYPDPKPMQTASWEKPLHTNGKAKFAKNAAGKKRGGFNK